MQKFKSFILFSILMLFLACGGVSNHSTKEVLPPKVEPPFAIKDFYPANGAKDVALDAKIKITFNKSVEHIDQDSITKSSLSMTDRDFNPVNGSFSYIANSIIFTPSDELKPQTKYIVSITIGIKDTKGKSLGLSQAIAFTTMPKPKESIPFKVEKTLPADSSTDIAINTQIIVYFSKAIDIKTATTTNVRLLNSANAKVPITISPHGKQMTIKPNQPLEGLSLYTINLNGVKDAEGNTLQLYRFSFKTDIKLLKLWSRLIGGSKYDEATDVSTDSRGNVYVVSNFNGVYGSDGDSFWIENTDVSIIKFDSDGNKIWSKLMGTDLTDDATGVSTDNNGNVYMVGYSRGNFDGHTNSGAQDAFMVKFDSDGNKIWSKLMGTTATDKATGVSTDNNGNVYMMGYSYGDFDGHTNSGNGDVFIVKFDSNGNKMWSKLMKISEYDEIWIDHVSIDSRDNVYVVGESEVDFDGDDVFDVFIVKFDSNGNKLWSKLMGTDSTDIARDVTTDSRGNVYMLGESEGDFDRHTNRGRDDAFMVKFDSNGNKLWSKLMGTAESDYAHGVSTDSSGNVYMVGQSNGDFDGHTNGGSSPFIVKFDSDGNKIWSKLMENPGSAKGVSTDNNGNIYMMGYSYGDFDGHTNSGNGDVFIVKFWGD